MRLPLMRGDEPLFRDQCIASIISDNMSDALEMIFRTPSLP